MKMIKRIPALFLAVCFALAANITVCAHEVPDMEKSGSISVSMKYGGSPVPGGTLTLYQVGVIHEDDGNYSFVLSDGFGECGESLEDPKVSGLAERLAKFAAEQKLTGKTVAVGNDGRAVAGGLMPGLYLVVQDEAADGYKSISPFLVSVPMKEDGTYVYEVDATPKMSTLSPGPDTPDSPDTPGSSDTPDHPGTPASPTSPSGSTLPQTGQLNWPVPVLTVLGLCLFLIGWVLRYGKKERIYEA